MPSDNPFSFLSQGNQTVTQQLQSVGQTVTSSISNGLTSAGHTISAVGSAIAALSAAGSDFFAGTGLFSTGSAQRVSAEQLDSRNYSSQLNSNPETKIQNSVGECTANFSETYPSVQAPYYMKLNFYKYARPNPLGTTTYPSLGSVSLPLPDITGASDSTNAGWTESPLGIFGNVFDNLKQAGNIIKQRSISQLTDYTTEAGMYAIQNAVAGINQDAAGVISSATGIAPNPSLSMLFNGVAFRTFNLKWTFVPENQGESQTIRKIIQFIKRNHLPSFSGKSTSFLFNYPALVEPQFIGVGQDYITKFKKCAITSVNVNYAPQGQVSFYNTTKAPMAIELSLALHEVEYMLSADYGGNLSTGNDMINNGAATIDNILTNLGIRELQQ